MIKLQRLFNNKRPYNKRACIMQALLLYGYMVISDRFDFRVFFAGVAG
jgi:hypothetical protein